MAQDGKEFIVCRHKFRYSPNMLPYKIINHTADIGIAVQGRTKKELFLNAVAALFDVMIELQGCEKGLTVKEATADWQRKTISIAGVDDEDLLINFLREALYLFNGEHRVVRSCAMTELSRRKVIAVLSGEKYNPRLHLVRKEIKAVTYHGLSVKKIEGTGWKARVIFDV